MKKLNRKGFTLIELLAVIVILAIIVVVTVPTIINSISDARVSSIWNLAVSTANSYDTMAAQDLIATNKTLTGVEATGTWKCIGDLKTADGTKSLASILDLSAADVVLDGEVTGDNDNLPAKGTGNTLDTNDITGATCSAIRIKLNGAAEVLLVAKAGGKFANAGKVVYALSSEDVGTAK